MTWQQQLMSQSWSQDGQANRKKKSKAVTLKKPASKGSAPAPKKNEKAVPANPETTMTWQQQLFQQSHRAGPTFDHAADEKDAETFGTPKGGKNKGSSSNAATVPDRRKPKNQKNNAKPRDGRSTATPTKEATATPAAAYAGPTFHNSPSAASLPTPRFSMRTDKATSSETPPTTAPSSVASPGPSAASPSGPPPMQTVDALLAQMLSPHSLSLGSK